MSTPHHSYFTSKADFLIPGLHFALFWDPRRQANVFSSYTFYLSRTRTHAGEGGTFALFQGLYPPEDPDLDDRLLTGDTLTGNKSIKKSALRESFRWPLLAWVRTSIFAEKSIIDHGIDHGTVPIRNESHDCGWHIHPSCVRDLSRRGNCSGQTISNKRHYPHFDCHIACPFPRPKIWYCKTCLPVFSE